MTMTNQAIDFIRYAAASLSGHAPTRLSAVLHAQSFSSQHRQSSIQRTIDSIIGRTAFAGGDDG